MDTVKQFGNELNAIQDTRPPVSRAKMGSITKLAMKAHKYYKHVVMLVEKFISKCSSEYKVPGLYVIDSIMRQSRHQFGASKESFGPRFTKNFEKTFLHLFQCPEEDKPKIVRVLNLWQKNEVFTPGVIQPLLALASSNASHSKPKNSERHRDQSAHSVEQHRDQDAGKTEESSNNNQNLDLSTATTIIQQQQEQISALLQQQQQLQTQATSLLAPALSSVLVQQQGPPGGVQQLEALSSLLQQTQQLQQLQAIQQRLANGSEGEDEGEVPAQISNVESVTLKEQPPLFNKAVLDDFDYSDEEDSLDRASQLARQKEREAINLPPPSHVHHDSDSGSPPHSTPLQREILEPLFPQQDVPTFSRESRPLPPPHIGINREPHSYPMEMTNNPPLPPSTEPFSPTPPPHHTSFPPPHNAHSRGPPSQVPPGPPPPQDWSRKHPPPLPPHFPPPPRSPSPRVRRESRFSSPPHMLRRSPSPPPHHRPWRGERDHERERDRERSRWSSPPRRRSRSPPLLPQRHSRDRSRSPPHSRWHRVTTPPENQERRRKGIPFPRDKHMTVCSTTLWVGHLSKMATKDMVKEAFEDFGQIKSVELVQARGCAYLVMMHRNDAMRALNSLRDLKLGGSTCKLAWAPGRGVKGSGLKAFWDQEVGSSYIPWSFIKTQADMDTMADGGWIDPPTFPPGFEPPRPPIDEESMEEEPEVVPPAPVDVQQQQQQQQPPPQLPMRNILPPSLPPRQNTLPTPSLPQQPPVNMNPLPTSMNPFPQVMNPTASFQPPGKIFQHFPPRGVPNSQPMPVHQPQPTFSQRSGVPFHGNIRHPMGVEPPQPTMPQQVHHPPFIGRPPHSMAPHVGGAPQHNLPPIGGPPLYTQVQMPMHRPQMTSMPQFPHGMPRQPAPRQPAPHQMMQPSTGNMQPFVPHMGGAQPPLLSPISRATHTLPQPLPQSQPPMGSEATAAPIRPLMPSRMGEPPHVRLPMAPHVGEGPPSLVPPFLSEGQPPLPPASNGPPVMPPLPMDKGLPFKPTSNAGQLPPLMGGHPPIPPPVENEPSPLPPPMDEEPEPSALPLPVDEEPKEPMAIPLPEEPNEPMAIPLPVDEEPKEPSAVPPPIDVEPKEPSVVPSPVDEETKELPLPIDGEPNEPSLPMDKEPNESSPMPPPIEEPKEPSPVTTDDQQEPFQMSPPTDEKPEWSSPVPPSVAWQDEALSLGPIEEQKATISKTPMSLLPPAEGPLADPQGQPGESKTPQVSEEPLETKLSPQQIETRPQELDYPIAEPQQPKDAETCPQPHPPEEPQEDNPHAQGTLVHQEDLDLHRTDQPPEANPQPEPTTETRDEPLDTILSDDDMQIATTDEDEMKISTSPDDSEFL